MRMHFEELLADAKRDLENSKRDKDEQMYKFNEEKAKIENGAKEEAEFFTQKIRSLEQTNNANQGEIEELNKFKNEKESINKEMENLR